MTRQQFIDEVNYFDDLKDFCYDVGCDLLDRVTTDDGRDDWISDEVDYYRRYEGWRGLADFLCNLSQDRYDWWEQDDDNDWYGLNEGSDFDRYKSDVLEWCDEEGVFSDGNAAEETSEADDEPIDEDAEEDFEPEDFGFDDLFSGAAAVFADETVRADEREEEMKRVLQAEQDAKLALDKEEEESFSSFVSSFAQVIF